MRVQAYEIMKSLDVDYVLIIFGGVIGYSGDDINNSLDGAHCWGRAP